MTGGGTVSTRLDTARLVIRTFEARDAGAWLAMATDPEVTRFLTFRPHKRIEDTQAYIASCLATTAFHTYVLLIAMAEQSKYLFTTLDNNLISG